MYPRNNASPERISIGPVVQISDGAVQTSGVAVTVLPQGGSETSGGGTVGYTSAGIVTYIPTQAETNYTSFILIASKAGCFPAHQPVVTTAESTAGRVQVGGYASGQAPLQPTVAGRTLAVDASGIVTDTAGTTTLLSRLTSTRAGLLDNLDVAISTIQSQITALNNLSAKANWFGSALLEIPDSGTRAYVFELVIKDDEDKLVNLDSLPTITLTNSAGTDRSSLITTGIANAATGRYTLTITVGTSTANEALLLKATGTVSGEARYAVLATQVVDYDSGAIINSIYTTLGVPATSTIAGDIAASKAVVDSVSGRIPSALVGGRMDVSVGAMASAVITAASIASGALNGKGDWRTALTLLGSLTETQWANLVSAALLGVTSQPSGTTEKFKHLDGTDAFTTTLDSNGNRTNVAIA